MNLKSQVEHFSAVLHNIVLMFFWLFAKATFTIQQDKNGNRPTVIVISNDKKYLSEATFEGAR